jgi:hypothetical protein
LSLCTAIPLVARVHSSLPAARPLRTCYSVLEFTTSEQNVAFFLGFSTPEPFR